MVKLKIKGKREKVKKGTTLMVVETKEGIRIQTKAFLKEFKEKGAFGEGAGGEKV